MVVSTLQPRIMKKIIARGFLLLIKCFLISSVLSLDQGQYKRFARKRIDNEKDIGRRYLESLWESVEKRSDTELEPRRLQYLESVMTSVMSMSFPTDVPTPRNPTMRPRPTSSNPPTPITPTNTPAPVTSPQPILPPKIGRAHV